MLCNLNILMEMTSENSLKAKFKESDITQGLSGLLKYTPQALKLVFKEPICFSLLASFCKILSGM